MPTFQQSVVIQKPPEVVFEFLANYENDPRWRSDVRTMAYQSPPPIGVGSRALEVASVLGQQLETLTEISEYEPHARVISRTLSGPTPVTAYRYFEPTDGGTRFTYRLDIDVSKALFFRLLQPVLIPWYQRRIETYLARAKEIVEAEY
ncbi:MAG: SRPBCC family protein [Chloroflexota bacterium]|nr:SRPBCC family protein [Chloroflexota bacterium]